MVLVMMPLLSFFCSLKARSQRKAEKRERVLAEGVNQAIVLQLQHKFGSFEIANQGNRWVAKEAALDAKYLSQRQLILFIT